MNIIDDLRSRCQKQPKILALPESDDPRVLIVGLQLLAENSIKKLYLFHSKKYCATICHSFRQVFDLEDKRIIWYDWQNQSEALAAVRDKTNKKPNPLLVANYLVSIGEADTLCAGAVNSTADVIRASLAFLPLTAGRTVSSSFLLHRQQQNWLFADCAVIIEPTAAQLVKIASATVDTFTALFPDRVPRVAFLSFSTKGSASHPKQKLMQEVARQYQEQYPDIISDGELQFDAAIDPAIAYSKAPTSKLKGNANCFIFPNLDAGNIGYKICQRLGGLAAFGPILQGFAKPVSDLSRGATSAEIKVSAYISLCRVQR